MIISEKLSLSWAVPVNCHYPIISSLEPVGVEVGQGFDQGRLVVVHVACSADYVHGRSVLEGGFLKNSTGSENGVAKSIRLSYQLTESLTGSEKSRVVPGAISGTLLHRREFANMENLAATQRSDLGLVQGKQHYCFTFGGEELDFKSGSLGIAMNHRSDIATFQSVFFYGVGQDDGV